jgi:predicted NAD/FAD-binding protein
VKIAVIGAGISGLVCAFHLSRAHDVVLFEKDHRLGGHTSTIRVTHEGRTLAVDTGFIVFNQRNYPRFCELLDRLGVASRPTTMSFSVRDDATGFEYGGQSPAGVIGHWSNLLRPRWWRVIRGVSSLGRRGKAVLSRIGDDATIGDLYASRAFSRGFMDDYLVPMAAAIWSAPRATLMDFPARFFLRFFDNHGMLDLRRRPQWRTVEGGSNRYIDAMMGVIGQAARLGAGVDRVTREPDGVLVHAQGETHRFDHVVLAAHSDQSLAMLTDPTPAERDILGAMPYQANHTVAHTDARLLPRRRACWAAWNYRLHADPARPVSVTYNMSILQGLNTSTPICVTLNDAPEIDPDRIIARFTYHHPIYTLAGERARARWHEISGVGRTHYCGAYWGNGFHEDGVVSGLRVCESLGVRP